MPLTNRAPRPMEKEAYLLKLPEPILDNILDQLSPNELRCMSEVCTCLMRRCRSNRLWEKHVQRRWGRLLGNVAYREWRFHMMRIMNRESPSRLQMNPTNGSLGSFTGAWPLLCLSSYLENPRDLTNLLLSNHSSMALYISLQSGRFWFPAQVYLMAPLPRRYHALLSYDHISNTFQARCPTNEWRLIEKYISWARLGLPPSHTSPYALYVSNNKNDLKPGDHVEVQMRKGSRAYDWCYGVIDHLKSCEDRNNHCSCEHSEMLAVVFNMQYSQWKSIVINRKVNGEQRNGVWRIGGIRKLDNLEDIRRWNNEYHI